MAAVYARFIFAREELVGKSIFSFLDLQIRVIVRKYRFSR
jgi:hypothetical protein